MSEAPAASFIDKIVSLEALLERLEPRRAGGETVVFTNGCFDILHPGHVTYLDAARRLGDLLVLGLNSDASVRGLKGPKRPILSERERATVLAALASVDYIVLFGEETPYALISAIVPDILVKGGDWPVSEIVGHDVVTRAGGEVRSLSFVEGKSTTSIIDRVLAAG